MKPSEIHYLLCLFVTGNSARSGQAIMNIRAICDERLPGRYQLEVIDVRQFPERAGPDQIIALPTLVRKLPGPARRVVGDMSDKMRVLIALGLEPGICQPWLLPKNDGF